MIVEKDKTVPTRDGHLIYCDVFRPSKEGKYPPLISFVCYGKDYHFSERDPVEYENSPIKTPYMNYEVLEPESWVDDGYVVIRCDSAGTVKSPGVVDVFGDRDAEHFYDVIEWAALQEWSSGRVGTIGVSYYSATQCQVAAKKPPHLACIVPWEVGSDLYRDTIYNGGILNNDFPDMWFEYWVKRNQHGSGRLSEEELRANRVDYPTLVRQHPLLDDFWKGFQADPSDIEVPMFTVGNFTGLPLVGRSHYALWEQGRSPHKWLRVHSGGHIANFYSQRARAEQKKFLDHFLKGADNGQLEVPPIELAIRSKASCKAHIVLDSDLRYEHEWPLARTQWQTWYLDGSKRSFSRTLEEMASHASVSFDADNAMVDISKAGEAKGDASAGYSNSFLSYAHYTKVMDQLDDPSTRVVFKSTPFDGETEVTGPIVLTLFVSTSDGDSDLFVTARCYDDAGVEVTFDGIVDNANVPMSVGWLRLSQRFEDAALSKDWRPVHTNDRISPVKAGEIYKVRIEIGPTSIIFEKGFRFAVEIGSRDGLGNYCYLHNDPKDRKYGGKVNIHYGKEYPSSVLIPTVPKRAQEGAK